MCIVAVYFFSQYFPLCLLYYFSSQDLFFAYPWNNFLHMTVESCIMAALFTVPPPPSLSSSSSSSLPASVGTTAAPTASQEGGGASQSNEGEDSQENSSGNLNHKSLRHHVSIDSGRFCAPNVCLFYHS